VELDSDYDPKDNENDVNNGDDDLVSQIDDINEEQQTELADEPARERTMADTNDDPAHDETVDASMTADNQRLNQRTSRCWGNKPNYSHLKGREGDGSLPTTARPQEFGANRISNNDAYLILESIVLTQYNLKQGIKKFGDKGKQALLNELQQLYDRDVIDSINPSDLTPEERKGALRYLMFLKEKRDGMIKGRGCADGRPQQDYMTKENTSSPTVAPETLLVTCLIDAIEKRDVATLDIPGAFMQSEMEGLVIMKLERVMAEIILKIDPGKYKKFTVHERRKAVVYVKLTKALYGTLQAALLFWQNLSSQLIEWGTLRMHRSISGTCSSSPAMLRAAFISAAITPRQQLNSRSAFTWVILNPRCRYAACTRRRYFIKVASFRFGIISEVMK
jgi:hypothetical protein